MEINYKIADMNLEMQLPGNYTFKEEDPYMTFRGKGEGRGIILQCIPCLKLPDAVGKIVYQDSKNRVFQNGDTITRYIGAFDGKDDMEKARCLIVHTKIQDRFFIYFWNKEKEISEKELFNCIGLEHLVAMNEEVILHSSFLEWKGEGLLFTAPSGTGKSTQAELWKKNREQIEIINGDRSILGWEEGPTAYGLPFCGSSGICLNKRVPLRAIVVLRQGTKNKIIRLGKRVALQWVFSKCVVNIWEKQDIEKVLDLLEKIVDQIPVFLYYCLPDGTAVNVLEQALEEVRK